MNGAAAVYFPACINRMFGRDPGGPASPSLPETFVALSERAGKPLWIPPDVAGLCCSTPWKSKGYPQGHEFMAKSIASAMLRWSDGGKIPIVVDAASCTLGLSQDIASLLDADTKAKYEDLIIIDSIAWCRDLLPKLTIQRKLGRIALHPTCSIMHLQLAGVLKQIAAHLADEVEVQARPAAVRPVIEACYIQSSSSRRRVRSRPFWMLTRQRLISQRTEPARWDFGTRLAGHMNRLSSCSRN